VGECETLTRKEGIRDVVVEREHDLALNMETWLVGNSDDHDDDEDHLEISSRGRV